MRIQVFIATSLDGFIARLDGSLDWLPQAEAETELTEDYGYQAFIESIAGVVIGRNTYEQVKDFSPWPYGSLPVVVLSHRPLELSEGLANTVTLMAETPGQVVEHLRRQGLTNIYIDGGKVIQQFLAAGLVTDLILSRIPILLGQGIPLFGPLPEDIVLAHVKTQSYATGLVQSHYRIGP